MKAWGRSYSKHRYDLCSKLYHACIELAHTHVMLTDSEMTKKIVLTGSETIREILKISRYTVANTHVCNRCNASGTLVRSQANH